MDAQLHHFKRVVILCCLGAGMWADPSKVRSPPLPGVMVDLAPYDISPRAVFITQCPQILKLSSIRGKVNPSTVRGAFRHYVDDVYVCFP